MPSAATRSTTRERSKREGKREEGSLPAKTSCSSCSGVAEISQLLSDILRASLLS